MADNNYHHINCITPHTVSDEEKGMNACLRACHEICSARLKCLHALNSTFGKSVDSQKLFVHAATKLVPLSIQFKHPLFAL